MKLEVLLSTDCVGFPGCSETFTKIVVAGLKQTPYKIYKLEEVETAPKSAIEIQF